MAWNDKTGSRLRAYEETCIAGRASGGTTSRHARAATALIVLGVAALGAPALAQPTEDHLACYKVKDPGAKREFTV